MPGPPPTPTAELKARGSWRAKTRMGEPEADGMEPTCPDVLKGEAKREWGRVVKNLSRLGILDQNDRGLIAAYCMAWARLHHAEKRTADLLEQAEAAEGSEADQIDKKLWRTEVSWRGAYNAFIKAADRLGVGAAARSRTRGSETREPEAGKARFFKTVG